MVSSIFRLVNIDRDQDRILTVRIKLYSPDDHHLKALSQHMQKKGINGKELYLYLLIC